MEKLARRDFDQFVPKTREGSLPGTARFVSWSRCMTSRGWDVGALWEEIKWEAKHFHHMERASP